MFPPPLFRVNFSVEKKNNLLDNKKIFNLTTVGLAKYILFWVALHCFRVTTFFFFLRLCT